MLEKLDWRHDGRTYALLHPAAPQQRADSTAARHGLWPMVPFANRAFGGVLLHDGEHLGLPINDVADGSTMHGFGWQAAWQVASHSDDSLVLAHTYQHADPYHYEARFSVTLSPGRASFALTVRNTGARALPFGLGLHPWFPRGPATSLRMSAGQALRFGPRYRATGVGPVDPADDYSQGKPLPRETAVSFIGWQGPALLSDAESGLAIRIEASENLRHPVLWTPADAPFICFEPQSHAIGAPSEALLQAATPMKLLEPGEEMAGWMTLHPAVL